LLSNKPDPLFTINCIYLKNQAGYPLFSFIKIVLLHKEEETGKNRKTSAE